MLNIGFNISLNNSFDYQLVLCIYNVHFIFAYKPTKLMSVMLKSLSHEVQLTLKNKNVAILILFIGT